MNSEKVMSFKRGDKFPVDIESVASGGESVARIDNFVIFVPLAAPGDRVVVELDAVKKNYATAKIVSFEYKSGLHVSPACDYFGRCGGCQLQHLSYEAQISVKRQIVMDNISRIGGLDVDVAEPLAMNLPLGYRNKVQFVASAGRNGISFGLYEKSSHKVVPIPSCPLQNTLSNEILNTIVTIAPSFKWRPYNEHSHNGELRHVAIRTSSSGDEALVVLVSNGHLPGGAAFAKKLCSLHPQIKGVVMNINRKRTNVILGDKTIVLSGEDAIFEEIKGISFKISSGSFFQVNTEGALRLAEVAAGFFPGRINGKILDAYCGSGFFSMFLAGKCRNVVGIEEFAPAVEDARNTAEYNGIDNAGFMAGKVEALLPEMISSGVFFDAVVLDPPRKGLESSVIDVISSSSIPSVIYVSCNPSTLARDLKLFSEKGYAVDSIQPVDMFPQTSHIECVAKLSIKTPD